LRHDLRWKGALILIAVLIFGFLLSPAGTKVFNGPPLRQGLDLQGGIELLLTPDYRVGANILSKLGDELSTKIKSANIDVQIAPLGTLDGDRYEGLRLSFANANDLQRARNLGIFTKNYEFKVFGETKKLNFEPENKGNIIELKILEDAADFPKDSLERSLAIIRNRINEKSGGMGEADVRLDEGKNRIYVQLPGIKSLQEAKGLITATGRLTFRINNRIVLDGTHLQDVRVNFDQNKRSWVISFQFKGDGAKQLAKITTENVNKQMAVYLDETMLMDPVIQDPIPDGSGIITLGGTPKEEVERYALLMKSGALPISLQVIQSTQVAPTLGKEIVKQSLVAGIIGVILVIGFMILFYGLPGIVANVALIFYVIFVLGIMALFRGVLTLPGIAGVILGVGMAVDANVIIFERIKDELRNGKRVRPAVQSGFGRALTTILDSNITTLIVAGVLFFFGSGPVQGFAMTLTISILVSMFTAIVVTRFLLEWRIDHDPDRYAKHFGVKEVAE
jgi:preprotein translocase subunit SecD